MCILTLWRFYGLRYLVECCCLVNVPLCPLLFLLVPVLFHCILFIYHLVCSVPACVNIRPSRSISLFHCILVCLLCFVLFLHTLVSFISVLFRLSDYTGGNGTIYMLPLMGVKVPFAPQLLPELKHLIKYPVAIFVCSTPVRQLPGSN